MSSESIDSGLDRLSRGLERLLDTLDKIEEKNRSRSQQLREDLDAHATREEKALDEVQNALAEIKSDSDLLEKHRTQLTALIQNLPEQLRTHLSGELRVHFDAAPANQKQTSGSFLSIGQEGGAMLSPAAVKWIVRLALGAALAGAGYGSHYLKSILGTDPPAIENTEKPPAGDRKP